MEIELHSLQVHKQDMDAWVLSDLYLIVSYYYM